MIFDGEKQQMMRILNGGFEWRTKRKAKKKTERGMKGECKELRDGKVKMHVRHHHK